MSECCKKTLDCNHENSRVIERVRAHHDLDSLSIFSRLIPNGFHYLVLEQFSRHSRLVDLASRSWLLGVSVIDALIALACFVRTSLLGSHEAAVATRVKEFERIVTTFSCDKEERVWMLILFVEG